MKTLLITGIGSDIAQAAARIVREVFPAWKIVGVDIHARHGGSLFCDVLETVVPASHPEYLRRMTQIVERLGVDICLPMSEAELEFIVRNDIRSLAGAELIGVARSALAIGLDKLETVRFLERIGVPAPWTVHATAAPPALPCIFKPRRSAGSKGVVVCSSAEEARWCASREPHGVFQELLLPADSEVTCAVYRANSGETAVLAMLRQLVGGFTGWAQVIEDPRIDLQCRTIATALDLRGAINVQLRLTAAGPRIFEINPRLSSTLYMRHLLGFQDFKWLIDEMEGRSVAFPAVAKGATVVRIQDAQQVSVDGT